jgi:hypothetical protein
MRNLPCDSGIRFVYYLISYDISTVTFEWVIAFPVSLSFLRRVIYPHFSERDTLPRTLILESEAMDQGYDV